MSIVTLCAIPDEVLIQGFWCLCSPLEEIIQQLHHILEGISEDAAHVAQHIHSGPPFQLLCTSNNMTAHLQHMITCRHLEHRRQTSCTVALHLHVAAADDVLIKPFVCRLLLLLHKQTPITCKYAAYTYTHKRFCKSFFLKCTGQNCGLSTPTCLVWTISTRLHLPYVPGAAVGAQNCAHKHLD